MSTVKVKVLFYPLEKAILGKNYHIFFIFLASKQQKHIRNGFSSPENLINDMLHNFVAIDIEEIWDFLVFMVAILDLAQTDPYGWRPSCLRWFSKTLDLLETLCKIAKTCHQVHDGLEFDQIPTLLW